MLAPRLPAIWGNATLAMEVSSTSMNAASATVAAISHGFIRGFHAACTAAAEDGPAGVAAVIGRLGALSDKNKTP